MDSPHRNDQRWFRVQPVGYVRRPGAGEPDPDAFYDPAVETALDIFSTTRADFADCLIGVLNRRAGCATTYTFDRRAAATAEFTAVG